MEALISFLLTLAIFSYLLGDIPLLRSIYRTAVYLFVGIARRLYNYCNGGRGVTPIGQSNQQCG